MKIKLLLANRVFWGWGVVWSSEECALAVFPIPAIGFVIFFGETDDE